MNYEYTYSNSSSIDPALAQGAAVVGLGLFLFIFFVAIVVYVYMAICLLKMAKKTDTTNQWMAWIPILNMVLLLQIGKKPVWWIILFFIPVVNIFITVLAWMGAAKELRKPEWLGILMIIPFANLIVPGYLAFSKEEISVSQEKNQEN